MGTPRIIYKEEFADDLRTAIQLLFEKGCTPDFDKFYRELQKKFNAKGLKLPSVNELWNHCVANGIDQPFDGNNPSRIMREVIEKDPATGCERRVYKHVLFFERVYSYIKSDPDLLSMACDFLRGTVSTCTTMAKVMNGKYFAPTADRLQTILLEQSSKFSGHLSASQSDQLKLGIVHGLNKETQAAVGRSRVMERKVELEAEVMKPDVESELSRNRVRERVLDSLNHEDP